MADELPGGGRDDGGAGDSTGGSGDAYLDQIKNLIPGIPDGLAKQLADILRANPGTDGLNHMFDYLRTTDWFGQAYAGFNQGAQSGLFDGSLGGLSGYRQWRHSVADSYTQYYGRDATVAELMDYGSRGYDANTIGEIGQGHSLAVSQGNDWQYYFRNFDQGSLSDAEKEAYGQLLSGRSSDLGLRIQARLQSAMQRSQSLFSGVLGQMGDSTSAGFAKPQGSGSSKLDIGA